jgi:hypothetical protein
MIGKLWGECMTASVLGLATGVVGILATLALIVMFMGVGPFGTINDVLIGVEGLLSAILAVLLLSRLGLSAGALTVPGVLFAALGAAVVMVGAYLVVSGRTGFVLAGLYMSAGFALIGAWVVWVNILAMQNGHWPDGLARFGLIVGAIMLVGFLSSLGITSRVDSFETSPWYVSLGWVSFLAWGLLYPVWLILLGRSL